MLEIISIDNGKTVFSKLDRKSYSVACDLEDERIKLSPLRSVESISRTLSVLDFLSQQSSPLYLLGEYLEAFGLVETLGETKN